MTLRSRILLLGVALLSVLVAFTAALPPRAYAEEPSMNYGPVGPSQPLLAKIGTQRVIAFFKPAAGRCAVMAVVWGDSDAEEPYASTRVRVDLKPGEMVGLDAADRKSMNLLCGADATSLSMVAPPDLVRTGSLNRN